MLVFSKQSQVVNASMETYLTDFVPHITEEFYKTEQILSSGNKNLRKRLIPYQQSNKLREFPNFR